jgi:hypothetical protein
MARHRRWPAVPQQVIVPSAARTTTGTGSAVTGWARNGHVAKLDVTAASGTTPQLTVTIQDSPDGSTWTTRDTFGVKTTVSNEVRGVPGGLAPFVRAQWTIAGTTPSFTFSVQLASSAATLV